MVEKNDYIIVLGQYLDNNGTLSLQCRERCFYAYTLYQEGKGNKFLLSGGVVNKTAIISEAEAMKNYLISMGVNKEIIVKEDESQNSYENAKFCSIILKNLGYNKLILVSSSYHIYRWYFNPVRFFKWFFKLKVVPMCCMDSLITIVNPFDAQKSSIFVVVEDDANLNEYIKNNLNKNIFLKHANSSIKKGLFMHKINSKDYAMLAKHLENIYNLKYLEIVNI
jgi:hypothetical protein